jgi:hypothetical protein
MRFVTPTIRTDPAHTTPAVNTKALRFSFISTLLFLFAHGVLMSVARFK